MKNIFTTGLQWSTKHTVEILLAIMVSVIIILSFTEKPAKPSLPKYTWWTIQSPTTNICYEATSWGGGTRFHIFDEPIACTGNEQ